jgi:hypothetical protein
MEKEVSVASRYYRSFRTGVPFIRLSGRWLDAMGFNEGARIRVSGDVGQLTLTISYQKRAKRPAG